MDLRKFLEMTESQIRSRRARPMVVQELRNHIEDQVADYVAEGLGAQEAEEEAVRQMGDPIEVGMQLDQVHQPKMDWWMLSGVILLSLVGFIIRVFVLSAAEGSTGNASLWENIGVFAYQLVYVAIGIVVMLFICRWNYSIIGRYAVPLWFVVVAGVIGYMIVGTPVYGAYMEIIPLTYLLIPIYAGIVYRYRGGGGKGLAKSAIFIYASLCIVLVIPAISAVLVLGITGTVTLLLAVSKGWFGKKKLRLCVGICAPIIMGIGAIIWRCFFQDTAEYPRARIAAIFSGEPMHGLMGAASAGEHIQRYYLWWGIFKYMGVMVGVVMTLAVFAIIFRMFQLAFGQKNQLGFMLGVSCAVFVLLQVASYLAMNFGYMGMSIGFCMPMFSYGLSSMCVTYVYSGILLSVYRNAKLVRN